ncbi:MAG: hypothetical protein JJT96_14720 [Opitutales bacterium]|nr:hypothetical protein [Opitutales bacterium]
MLTRLKALEKAGSPIRVGIAGAGAMGRGIVAAVHRTPGMRVAWVTDLFPERASEALAACRTYEDSTCSMGFAGVTIFQE